MKKLIVLALSVLTAAGVFGLPKISDVSCVVSGGSSSGKLKISYTLSDTEANYSLSSRYVQLRVYGSIQEAKTWTREIGINYPKHVPTSLPTDAIDFRFNCFTANEVSNGKHSFTIDLLDYCDMTAQEFKSEFRSPYLAAAVFDDSKDASSTQIVSIGFDANSWMQRAFSKAQTLSGLCLDDEGNYYAVVSLKLAKLNPKTSTVKATMSITPLSGQKKTTVSATLSQNCCYLAEDGVSGDFLFKSPIGDACILVSGDADDLNFSGTSLNGYEFFSADIGGPLEADSLSFSVDMNEEPDFGYGWELVATPDEEIITVSRGTKFTMRKSPTLRYKRYSEYGYVWYELDGLDDPSKPNVCGLKLTYTSKTGTFKGSYTLYASNACCIDGKPTLKKIKVSVSGIFIDGYGVGTATTRFGADTYSWPVTLDPYEIYRPISW